MDISPDFIVLGLIWKAQKEGKPIGFRALVEELDEHISRARISLADDRLHDLGLVVAKMTEHDGLWSKLFYVEPIGQRLAEDILTHMQSKTTAAPSDSEIAEASEQTKAETRVKTYQCPECSRKSPHYGEQMCPNCGRPTVYEEV